MIKVEKIETWGFEHAIRGMRNPMNSHDRLDSQYVIDTATVSIVYGIGKNDLKLMRQLYKAGTEHRKYLRQIFVSMDITSNHTFWSQFDTYKINTTKNSCSKMHRIHVREFVREDFTHEYIDQVEIARDHLTNTIEVLNELRDKFNKTKDKIYWRAMIDLLPLGYNLKATVTMNYENVFNMIHQRGNHKLDEWKEFVKILKGLPYVTEIGQFEEKGEENV